MQCVFPGNVNMLPNVWPWNPLLLNRPFMNSSTLSRGNDTKTRSKKLFFSLINIFLKYCLLYKNYVIKWEVILLHNNTSMISRKWDRMIKSILLNPGNDKPVVLK